MGLTVTITDAGRAALRNAAGNGTNAVTIAAVGLSSQAFTPGAAIPAEIKRLTTISGGATAADTIHVTVLDSGSDDYSVYGFALYLTDGTLFASYGQSTVIVEKSAQAMMQLALDVRFVDVADSSISFGDANFMNPAATEDTLGVVMLATGDEVATGTDVQKALTPATFKSGLDARFGSGAPSSFFKSLMTSASTAVLRTALAIKGAALYDTGAGNGLDADLLDGNQGAFYLDYGNLKNTPTNVVINNAGLGPNDLPAQGLHLTPAQYSGNGFDQPQFSWLVNGVFNNVGLVTSPQLVAGLEGKLDAEANAVSASKWQTARKLTISGVVGGWAMQDGSGDSQLNVVQVDGALNTAAVAGLQDALNTRMLNNVGMGANDLPAQGMHLTPAQYSGTGFDQPQFSWLVNGVFTDVGLATSPQLIAGLGGKLDAGANAVSASKWQTARKLTISGVVGGWVMQDGSGDTQLNVVQIDGALSTAAVSGLQEALTDKISGSGGKGADDLAGTALHVTPASVTETGYDEPQFGWNTPAGIYTSTTLATQAWVSGAANAASASKWQVARKLTISGVVGGWVMQDGSGDTQLNVVQVDGALNTAAVAGLQDALNSKLDASQTQYGTIAGGYYIRIGDILIQSFTVSVPTGGVDITFPIAFSATPVLVPGYNDANSNQSTVQPTSISATGAHLATYYRPGSNWSVSGGKAQIIVMGPA